MFLIHRKVPKLSKLNEKNIVTEDVSLERSRWFEVPAVCHPFLAQPSTTGWSVTVKRLSKHGKQYLTCKYMVS